MVSLKVCEKLIRLRKLTLIASFSLTACSQKLPSIQTEQDQVIKKVAKSAEKKHYYDYAAGLRKKYLHLHPHDFKTMEILAQDLSRAGNWKKSLYYYAKLSRHKPNDNKIRLALANSYLHVGAWELAFAEYESILMHNPGIQAYNGMGVILNAAKHFKSANSCFDKALLIDAHDATSLNNKALTLALMGRRSQARAMLKDLALINQNQAYSDNLRLISKNKPLWPRLFKLTQKLNLNYTCKQKQGA